MKLRGFILHTFAHQIDRNLTNCRSKVSCGECNEMSELLAMWGGKVPGQCGSQTNSNLQPGFTQYSQQSQWYSGVNRGLLENIQRNPQPLSIFICFLFYIFL